MRALVIAHEPEDTGGQIERRLTARGIEVDTHVVLPDPTRPDRAAPYPDVEGYDLLLPMGSEYSLTRPEEIATWAREETALLRAAHDARTPIFGVCFGGQLLAEALGGSVEPSPITEIGWFDLAAEPAAPEAVGLGPWFQWHHDRFVAPPGAAVLARSAAGAQLFRLGATVGTQFHPEVDVAHVTEFLTGTPAGRLERFGVTPAALLEATRRNEAAAVARCHALVDWFLDEVI